MSTTAIANHGAQANTTILPPVRESFDTIARYLRESAFGPYCETVSPDVIQASHIATLWLVANDIQDTGIGLEALREDTGMTRLVETVHWLSGRGTIHVGGSHTVPLRSTPLDERTWRLGDLQIVSSRARMDAGYMRAYVHRVAAQWSVCTSPRLLIETLGRSTGSMVWMRAASAIVEAGECR